MNFNIERFFNFLLITVGAYLLIDECGFKFGFGIFLMVFALLPSSKNN